VPNKKLRVVGPEKELININKNISFIFFIYEIDIENFFLCISGFKYQN